MPQMRGLIDSLARPPRPSETFFTSGFVKYASSIPFLSLSAYAFMFGDRIMVAEFFSLHEVGQYSYMFVLTTSVVVFAHSVYATATYLNAIEELSIARRPEDQSRTIRHFIRLSLIFPLCFVPLVWVYSLFDEQIVKFLFGQTATVPSGCLSLLLLSASLNYGAQLLSNVGNLLKCQQRFIAPRWTLVGFFFAGLAIYHPSLYGVSVLVLCVNSIQFFVTGVMVYRMQLHQGHPSYPSRQPV
jgi:O-antigen/teichoic acid export membrane protein